MSSVVGKTVHRGSRSIDFISHNVKSSITQPKTIDLEGVQLEMDKISKFKAHDKPIHSYYRPSDIRKLLKTLLLSGGPAGGIVPVLESRPNRAPEINLTPNFNSSREVIALLSKVPKNLKTLKIAPIAEYHEAVNQEAIDQINELLKDKIPDEIMELQLQTQDGTIITNEEKLKVILSSQSITRLMDLLKDHIIKAESATFASNIAKSFLNRIKKLRISYKASNSYTRRISSIEEILKANYPTTRTDMALKTSFLETYIHVKNRSKAQSSIYEMISQGYSPPATTFEAYLKLLVQDLTKERIDKAAFLSKVAEFDDVFHTVMNVNIASLLMKTCTTLEEANYLLNQLQSRYQGEELAKAYGKTGDSLVDTIINFKKYKSTVSYAVKNSLVTKFEKVTPLSNDSKLKLLENSVEGGSLIFASKLLSTAKVNQVFISLLKEKLSSRIFEQNNDKPGFDLKSKRAFMKELEKSWI